MCAQALDLSQTKIMGVLNVTPDSFSDGGLYERVSDAAARAREMILEGVDIIDVGGQSSAPGSKDVSLHEELRRVISVFHSITALCGNYPWISVDTYRAEVAKQAIEHGAKIVNDITALRGDKNMAKVIAKSDVSLVLMYSKDSTARTTQKEIHYDDVVKTIFNFFQERLHYAFSQGIRKEQIILDPGMGAFVSSDSRYSVEILRRLDEFHTLGFPLLVGASRKGFIGKLLGNVAVSERLYGSLACAASAVLKGVHILRVHDVKETKQFLQVFQEFL